MGYFDWTDELSVGIKEIDDQHRRLVDMLNTLGTALRGKHGRDVQKAVVDGLVDLAISHIAEEERYMKLHGYPGLEAHRAEHEKLSAWATDLKERVGRGFVVTLEVLDRFKGWLQNHFTSIDRHYAS